MGFANLEIILCRQIFKEFEGKQSQKDNMISSSSRPPLSPTIVINLKSKSNTSLNETLNDLQQEDVKLLETRNDVDLLEDIKDHPAFQKFIEV